jgi:predicted nucleic acid-binding protein
VIDASVALAWGLADEASEQAERVLVGIEGCEVVVPALWTVEITNALVVAERRKRIREPDIRRFVELLGGLAVRLDALGLVESVSNLLPLAREYGLPAYDAAYLDVALRHEAALASLDERLQKAAKKAGVEAFPSGG